MKWKHFPRYWPFVRGIHRSPVNSPHKGQWRWAFMFSLICAWMNRWVNNREAGDLRRYLANYDVIVYSTYHDVKLNMTEVKRTFAELCSMGGMDKLTWWVKNTHTHTQKKPTYEPSYNSRQVEWYHLKIHFALCIFCCGQVAFDLSISFMIASLSLITYDVTPVTLNQNEEYGYRNIMNLITSRLRPQQSKTKPCAYFMGYTSYILKTRAKIFEKICNVQIISDWIGLLNHQCSVQIGTNSLSYRDPDATYHGPINRPSCCIIFHGCVSEVAVVPYSLSCFIKKPRKLLFFNH